MVLLRLKKHWWPLLFFALAVACDATMDYFNFQVVYNSGWWSITDGWNDVWHWLKKLKWLFIVFAIVGKDGLKWNVMFAYAVINLVVHEVLYHKILKRK